MKGLRTPMLKRALVASAVRTSSSNAEILLDDVEFQNALIKLDITQASGTSPTLDVYIQQSLDGGTTYVDMAHSAQITASAANAHYINLGIGGENSVAGAVGDASISASALGTTPVSPRWRVKWVIGGTSPAFTFSVDLHAA